MIGLIGRKVGMTQIPVKGGEMAACTVVEAGPCHIMGTRTQDTHQYQAVRLGFGEVKRTRLSKPLLGEFESALGERETYPARFISEFRVADVSPYDVGSVLCADLFSEDEKVDVTGVSKGKGFTGLMKRWNFHGGPKTHGSKFHRRAGSIGQHTDPGRVWKGKKMAGHHGVYRKTISNLAVVKVLKEKNLIVLKGHVPGPAGGIVIIRKAKRG
jgi:large subunit ribosomal protein L3